MVVRPDVLVVCGSAPAEHLHDTPSIIAEVLSPRTRARDTNEKRDLYAQQRVQHYLLVDPDGPVVTACKLERPGEYVSRRVEDMVELDICNDCTLQVDLARLSR
jgi:Uma2 family endonuclease